MVHVCNLCLIIHLLLLAPNVGRWSSRIKLQNCGPLAQKTWNSQASWQYIPSCPHILRFGSRFLHDLWWSTYEKRVSEHPHPGLAPFRRAARWQQCWSSRCSCAASWFSETFWWRLSCAPQSIKIPTEPTAWRINVDNLARDYSNI